MSNLRPESDFDLDYFLKKASVEPSLSISPEYWKDLAAQEATAMNLDLEALGMEDPRKPKIVKPPLKRYRPPLPRNQECFFKGVSLAHFSIEKKGGSGSNGRNPDIVVHTENEDPLFRETLRVSFGHWASWLEDDDPPKGLTMRLPMRLFSYVLLREKGIEDFIASPEDLAPTLFGFTVSKLQKKDNVIYLQSEDTLKSFCDRVQEYFGISMGPVRKSKASYYLDIGIRYGLVMQTIMAVETVQTIPFLGEVLRVGYTEPEPLEKIEPILIDPMERRWEELKKEALRQQDQTRVLRWPTGF